MKKVLLFAITCVVGFAAISCGVSRNPNLPKEPDAKEISFNSDPQGAAVYIEGKYLGTTPMKAVVPLKYQFYLAGFMKPSSRLEKSSELSSQTILFVKNGYEKKEVTYKPTINYSSQLKNYNGQLMSLDYVFPEGVFCSLEKSKDYASDPTIPAGEAENRVTRDNPGQSELERTIIRWYFDSAPRGARVFWRVISSVPAEVKNTNELYLGPTPFEEPRSFNILGLTYANSRDVQIEIKVTKKGFMDQVKRFNVRQAIDQQEISSFFELVPAE